MNWYKFSQNKISYSAVVLDEMSRNTLISEMKKFIPEEWKVIAHHMTINLGPLKKKENLGKEVEIIADSWAKDQNAIAVTVRGYERDMPGNPHITIAINEPAGAKAKDSNNLSGWQPLSSPISLRGRVEEVPFK